MSQPILSMSAWVAVPNEVRIRIRNLFSIPRSTHVFVDDGVLMSDGTTPQDFQALTTEKMQEFLQSDSSDFHKLFDLTVAKIQEDILNKATTQMPVIEPEIVAPPVVTPIAIKKTKNVKKTSK